MTQTSVTMHGTLRLGERMDIRSEDAAVYVCRVWTRGKTVNDYKGEQRKKLEDIRTRHCEEGIELRLFGGACYIFDNNGTLITCYDLPQWFKKVGRPKPPRTYDGDDEDVSALVLIIKKPSDPSRDRTAFLIIWYVRARMDLI